MIQILKFSLGKKYLFLVKEVFIKPQGAFFFFLSLQKATALI